MRQDSGPSIAAPDNWRNCAAGFLNPNTDICRMKREADIVAHQVRGIEAAIEADDLNRALELLKAMVEPMGHPRWSDAILLKSRYSEIRDADRSG